MKELYFECFSGISGDMTLAALNDLGVPADYITAELNTLGLEGFEVKFEKTMKNMISAVSAKVVIDRQDHSHRHHSDIVKIIDESGITAGAKKIAKDIFLTIAEAEAKIHGKAVNEVHFHEVGALDSIVDIVGTAICVDYLKPDIISAGIINDGYGFVNCQHGKIPVPVPATAEIFAAKGVKFRKINVEAELVTPTGAGIIATLADVTETEVSRTITKIGYGAGSAELEIPNLLRVCICERNDAQCETAAVIETNIDNQTPESLAFALERLLAEGALDAFFQPIYMKKNRPAVKLTVICRTEDTEKMSAIIFENTSTIGVRMREEKRVCLPRELGTVETRYGDVDIKISHFGDYKKIAPEFESAKTAAIKSGVPLDEVYSSVYESLLVNKNV